MKSPMRSAAFIHIMPISGDSDGSSPRPSGLANAVALDCQVEDDH